MKTFVSWLMKRALNWITTSVFILVGIVGLTYALSYPSTTPTGETPGGKFGTYFANLFSTDCGNGQAVYGFSANGTKKCRTVMTEYQWTITGFWSCSASCGTSGMMNATYQCKKYDGTYVSDSNCPSPKPISSSSCNGPACPVPTPAPTPAPTIIPPWVVRAPMPTLRWSTSAAVANNKIYVFGGKNSGLPLWMNQEYDPTSNTWSERTTMLTPRSNAASAAIGNKIYVMGGYASGIVNAMWGPIVSSVLSAKNEEYDVASNTWTTKAPVPVSMPGFSATAVAIGTKIYYFHSTATYVYDAVLNTWSTKTKMPTPRGVSVAVAIGTDIYILGWHDGNGITTKKVEKYNTLTNTWISRADMNYALEGHTAVALNGFIYVTWGRSMYINGASEFTERYSPSGDTWHARASWNSHFWASSAVVNNKIYIIGWDTSWWVTVKGTNMEYDYTKDLTP